MKIEMVKTGDLIPYHNNPRKNDGAVDYQIYGIINNKNSKMYIGQTTQGYRKRFSQHLSPSDGSPALKNAVSKYGADAFDCELLDFARDQEDANIKEKMWISALGTYKKENGYNLSMGGSVGNFNAETRKKMSVSKIGSKNSFYGKRHTQESKDKMSKLKKGNYALSNHPSAKSVKCVETGIVYDCVVLAGIETGSNSKHIGQVANKRYGRKTTNGYHWEWI